MISKELLTELIREKRVILDYEISIDKTEIHYGHKDIDEDGFINIYELANKCKKWAFKNGYWLSVRLYEPNGFNIVVFSHINSQLQKDLKEINDKTEIKAIFKACEWIFKSLKALNDK